jgi:hypothetical protein
VLAEFIQVGFERLSERTALCTSINKYGAVSELLLISFETLFLTWGQFNAALLVRGIGTK